MIAFVLETIDGVMLPAAFISPFSVLFALKFLTAVISVEADATR